ncbi:MAG: internal scaffolding protein [Arizlama microvirus]|nr:MAG: internal scaffolding protein [Arizlama microvirus]
MNIVALANEQFANLSAHVRKRFQNDPQEFLQFTSDPENLPEMVKLGLAIKRETNQTNTTPIEPQQTTIAEQKKEEKDEVKK